MADRGDTHYHVPKLNLWFAASSILLFVSAVWMVIDDWDRSWKDYQRDFFELELERARAALETPDAQAALAEEDALAAQLAAAENELDATGAEIGELEDRLFQARGDLFVASEAEKSAKQEYNWTRYEYEEGHAPKEELDEWHEALIAAGLERERVEAEVNALEAEVKARYAERDAIEKRMKAATKDVDLVRKKLAKLDPEDMPTKVAEIIRDFPGLDFIGPNIKVRKVVLDDLTFELNFTQKPRIDMCQTCHMAAELEGYGDDVEQPFRSHPRLDLFLSAKSPHPLNEVGCTICHRGSGESLHFVRADHRPTDETEGEEWYHDYHWHKQHHWDYPMLSSEHVEASCVQCHKTSMELIADEAPDVTEGYRLFERYGCYACHKVEWYPTQRRPGPSLKGVLQKTDPAFIASWIADPRGFRPSTWMPQFFHLENWPDDEVVLEESDFGRGGPIVGQQWNDTMVAAITAFLEDRAVPQPAAPLPEGLEGDPVRGEEVFTLAGCLACHNMSPFPASGEEPALGALALRDRGTNEHGPNLRGVATKVTPEWLYHWIDAPSAYWSETRMPDLNLEPQDIADVVAYVFEDPDGTFRDVPEGWEASEVAHDPDALRELARWWFGNRTQAQFDAAFANEWAEDDRLLVDVGEKLVLGHGCHSCHEIAGLESQMPIGTELTTWGSKTVDKLDFGFMPEILKEERGWSHHETEEFRKYREGWLVQKLHAPRSYDRPLPGSEDTVRVKNPVERLKMPWFDFEQDEIQALTTFVVGLVKDEVQRARMEPTAGDMQMDHGLRVIRQKNCAACHVIEPGQVIYRDEDGVEHTVSGQVLALDDEEWVAPPMNADFHPFVAEYEKEVLEGEDLEEVIVQLLRPEPGIGQVGDTVVVEGAETVDEVEITPAWGGDFVNLVVGYYRGRYETADPDGEYKVQDVDGEWRDYSAEEIPKVRWTFAPPFLVDEGYKLQRDWFHRFLIDPYPLRRQMRVKMPKFNWADGEAGAVADYFAQAAARDYPVRYSRRALLANDMTPAQAAGAAADAGISVSADVIANITQGSAPAIESSFPKLAAWASADAGFQIPPPVDPSYEALYPRAPSVFESQMAEHPDFWEGMHRLTGPDAINCFQCHWLQGEAPKAEGPIAWAPDLRSARERLRPDWVHEWLADPAKIYPGTAMPSNFIDDQYQDAWPKPSPEQLEDVLLWLFNLDRDPTR
jgi:cytochrome c2